VEIPLVDSPPDAAEGNVALSPCDEAALVAGRRILVVEDNEDAAVLLEMSLAHMQHDVRVVSNAGDALALVEHWVPDIAILDIGLPDLDGYELACRLRAMPQLSRLRLIALTGYGGTADRDRARRAGFDAHVIKPARMDALRAVLLG
jgi:CheY-like chemotaxis protein